MIECTDNDHFRNQCMSCNQCIDCHSPCLDCGVDTYEINEYYMVRDDVWTAAVSEPCGQLCIGCLEERIGRHLSSGDFTGFFGGDPSGNSRRLNDRLTALPDETD